MEENTVKTAEKEQKAPGVPFTKDDPRINRDGRPKGTENFTTKWRKAVEKIAKTNNITEDEVEMQLLLTGYKKAKEGDYRFYQDVFDRIYGKPLSKNETDITSGGKPIIQIAPEIIAKHEINTSTEQNS